MTKILEFFNLILVKLFLVSKSFPNIIISFTNTLHFLSNVLTRVPYYCRYTLLSLPLQPKCKRTILPKWCKSWRDTKYAKDISRIILITKIYPSLVNFFFFGCRGGTTKDSCPSRDPYTTPDYSWSATGLDQKRGTTHTILVTSVVLRSRPVGGVVPLDDPVSGKGRRDQTQTDP